MFVQKFDATTGAVLLDPLGKEVYPISTNSDIQAGAIGLYSADNPLFMSYDVNYKIRLTALDGLGNFVIWSGFPYELSSTTATLALAKGRFAFTYDPGQAQAVAVWYENRGTEYRAYAQNRNLLIIPVTLVDFHATKNNKTVTLFWNTSSENNNKGFYIERSTDGNQYKSLGFVQSKSVGGNSNINLDYTAVDDQPSTAINYYRLKQVDLDGKYVYSKTVLVRFDKPGSFYINNIYPKPATDILHVSVEAGMISNGNLTVVDMNGKTVIPSNIVLSKGNNIFHVDISSLSKGIYFLKINNSEKETAIEKWIKQ